MAQVDQKQFESLLELEFEKKKEAGSDKQKARGGKRAVPGRAISALPHRQGGAPTPVLSSARRSAAVRMGRGGTARPPEAEWSSGAAAFLGGCYNQDIFKDPRERHDHLSVLPWYIIRICRERKKNPVRNSLVSNIFGTHLGCPKMIFVLCLS